MPRQPFHAFSDIQTDYSVGYEALDYRPEFAEIIGKCIGLWTHVDNEIAGLLSILLGSPYKPALKLFLTIRKSRAQHDAILAVAEEALDTNQRRVLNAVMTVYLSLEKQRNFLAHGCFGHSPNHPEYLLCIPLDDHVAFHTKSLSSELRGEAIPADRHADLKEKMSVYKMNDLEGLYANMKEFWQAIFWFNGYLRDPENAGRITEFQKLQTLPQISQQLQV